MLFYLEKGKKMKEEEYKECRYIEDELKFCTYQEFLENAEAIKKQYEGLNNLIFYRWYVFSHDFSLGKKTKIWEFLNGDINYTKLTKGK